VVGSLVLPLLINEATESEPAAWIRPTVAITTLIVALQAVRVERQHPPQGSIRSDQATAPDEPHESGAQTSSTRSEQGHRPEGHQTGSALVRDERKGGRQDISLIDHDSAQAARVYDFLLGGSDHFEVDRQLARKIYSSAGGLDKARVRVRANRNFLGRAVRYLAGEAGVRQFLDLGTGIPNSDKIHGAAQAVAPDARVVYVDNDAVVLAHAHTLRSGSRRGATKFVFADLRDHDQVLEQASDTLDLSRPVALVMVGVLHHFRDDEHPEDIIGRYLDALPSGSYLVLENIGKESDDVAKLGEIIDTCPAARFTLVPRTRTELTRFFAGTELVDPGVVYVDRWRPNGPPPVYETRHPCGIGRKP